jgi:hypothetical protein
LPCRPTDRPCTYCGANPSLGHEDVCRAASRKWISRHDQITRAFIKTLSSLSIATVEAEPSVAPNSDLRADFSVLIGTSPYYYDVQIVAINKDSSREDAYSTLAEAAEEKKRKYSCLGSYFKPLIFSAGGLMAAETADHYKGLQKLLGPSRSNWLSNSLAFILTRARAVAATSIARDTPRNNRT